MANTGHAGYGRINSNSSSEKEVPSAWSHPATLTCGQRFKAEFKSSNFLLSYDYPGVFGKAQCGSTPVYLVWRVLWATYHVSAIATSGYLQRFYVTRDENRIKWFIFLTNWCYFILTCSAILDLIISVHFYINRQDFLKGAEAQLPWYCKVFWVMTNISNAIGVEISLIYWLLLHDFTRDFYGHRILPFLTHGMNVIYIVLNLLVTAMPVRLLHFYQPALFGIMYIIFSVVYTLCGGSNDQDQPYIYSILDWNNTPTLTAGITVGASVGAIIVHAIVYFIQFVRICMFQNCQPSNDEVIV